MTLEDHEYRDSSGKRLEDYPRPSVAVDTAVLTIEGGELKVLLTIKDSAVTTPTNDWQLPGTFLHVGETLADAVRRSLDDRTGMRNLDPVQLHVFDDPKRDDRGWVLSVAHLAATRVDRLHLNEHSKLFSVSKVPHLKYDHSKIVAFAVETIRERYRHAPDPFGLLPDPIIGEPKHSFVMRDLRMLHDAIADKKQNPDVFRRTMIDHLKPTGQWRKGARGKPAELYVRG